MCGIIGYTGHRPGVPVVVEGLRRLEYRGYDSAGVAFGLKGGLAVIRAKGKLAAGRPWRKALAYGWAALICISTVFTKQHSVIDVVCGLALVAVWYYPLYGRKKAAAAPKM